MTDEMKIVLRTEVQGTEDVRQYRAEMAGVRKDTDAAVSSAQRVGKQFGQTATEINDIKKSIATISPTLGRMTTSVNQLSQALKKLGINAKGARVGQLATMNRTRPNSGGGYSDVMDTGTMGMGRTGMIANRSRALTRVAGVAGIGAVGASLFNAITGSGSKLASFDKLNTLGSPNPLDALMPEVKKVTDDTGKINQSLTAVQAEVAALNTNLSKVGDSIHATIDNPAEIEIRYILDDKSEQTIKDRRAEIETDIYSGWHIVPEIDISKKREIDDQKKVWAENVAFSVIPYMNEQDVALVDGIKTALAEWVSFMTTTETDGSEAEVQRVKDKLSAPIIIPITFNVNPDDVLEPTLHDAYTIDAVLDGSLNDLTIQAGTALKALIADARTLDGILDGSMDEFTAEANVAMRETIRNAKTLNLALNNAMDELIGEAQTALKGVIEDAKAIDSVLDGAMDELTAEAGSALREALRNAKTLVLVLNDASDELTAESSQALKPAISDAITLTTYLNGASDELTAEADVALREALRNAKTLILVLNAATDELTIEAGQAIKPAIADALTLMAVLGDASDQLTVEAGQALKPAIQDALVLTELLNTASDEMGEEAYMAIRKAIANAMSLKDILNEASDELTAEAGEALKGAVMDAMTIKAILDSAMDGTMADSEVISQIIASWGATEEGSIGERFHAYFIQALADSLAVAGSIGTWGATEEGSLIQTFTSAFMLALQASGMVAESIDHWGDGLAERLASAFIQALALADQINSVIDDWVDPGTAGVIDAVSDTFQDIEEYSQRTGDAIGDWFPDNFGDNALASMKNIYNYAVETARLMSEMNGTEITIGAVSQVSGASTSKRVKASDLAKVSGPRSSTMTEAILAAAEKANSSKLYGSDGGLSEIVTGLIRDGRTTSEITEALISAGVAESAASNILSYASGEIGTVAYKNALNVIRQNGGIVTGESYGEKARQLGYTVGEFTQEDYQRTADLMMEALLNPTAKNVNALDDFARSFQKTITAESYAHYGTDKYGAGYQLIDEVAEQLGFTNSDLISAFKERVEKDYNTKNGVELADEIGRLVADDSKAREYLAKYTEGWNEITIAGQKVKGLDELGDGSGYWVVNPSGELQYINGSELMYQQYKDGRFQTNPNSIIHHPRQSTFSINEADLDNIAGTDYYKAQDGTIYYKWNGGFIEQHGIDFDPDRARAIEGERAGRIEPVELDTGGYIVTGADGQAVYVPYGSSIYEDKAGHIYSIPDIQTDGNKTWYLNENNERVYTGTIADPNWGTYTGGRNSGVIPTKTEPEKSAYEKLIDTYLNMGASPQEAQATARQQKEVLDLAEEYLKQGANPQEAKATAFSKLYPTVADALEQSAETQSETRDLIQSIADGYNAVVDGIANGIPDELGQLGADIGNWFYQNGISLGGIDGIPVDIDNPYSTQDAKRAMAESLIDAIAYAGTGAVGGAVAKTASTAVKTGVAAEQTVAVGAGAGSSIARLGNSIASNPANAAGVLLALASLTVPAIQTQDAVSSWVQGLVGWGGTSSSEGAGGSAAADIIPSDVLGHVDVPKDNKDPEAGYYNFYFRNQEEHDQIYKELAKINSYGPTMQKQALEEMEKVYAFGIGGVFMPNSPQLAILGDNRTEPEVAAPYSLIVSAVADALRAVSIESEGIKGGADDRQPIELVVNLNGKEVAREMYPDLKREDRRLNGGIFA